MVRHLRLAGIAGLQADIAAGGRWSPCLRDDGKIWEMTTPDRDDANPNALFAAARGDPRPGRT